jgi:hypothetical protein
MPILTLEWKHLGIVSLRPIQRPHSVAGGVSQLRIRPTNKQGNEHKLSPRTSNSAMFDYRTS